MQMWGANTTAATLPTPLYPPPLSCSATGFDRHISNFEVPPIKSYSPPRTVWQITLQLFWLIFSFIRCLPTSGALMGNMRAWEQTTRGPRVHLLIVWANISERTFNLHVRPWTTIASRPGQTTFYNSECKWDGWKGFRRLLLYLPAVDYDRTRASPVALVNFPERNRTEKQAQ